MKKLFIVLVLFLAVVPVVASAYNAVLCDEITLDPLGRNSLLAVLTGCVNPQGFARERAKEILGEGSDSLSKMAAIAMKKISRAAELGLGTVNAAQVNDACQP